MKLCALFFSVSVLTEDVSYSIWKVWFLTMIP